MKIKFTLLILILAIRISSYCQETYPREIILNKDTIIGITEDQLKEINIVFSENSYYKEVIDSTELIIRSINETLLNTKETYLEYGKLIVLMNEQLESTNRKVLNAENNLKIVQDELKLQKKKTIKLAVISSSVTVSTISLIYFLTK